MDVSIIIPTWSIFNKKVDGKLAIEGGLESIQNQLHEGFQFELVFVDDASPDETVKWIKDWIEKHPEIPATIYVLGKNSGGPSEPRNLGMKMAKGKYIAFMDNDDQLGGEGSLYEMFVKPSPEIVGKDFKLFISNRELTSYISSPFEEEITINIQSIKEFLVRNKTIDFYVGRETEAGIAATKIAGKYSEKIYPYLSKNKRPVLYTWEDEKSIELYVNWKGGLGLLVE
ncbi:glycosyltransferase [Lactococcus garvieae]|nr:glycosyltransferase [Lactococcus garvieae]